MGNYCTSIFACAGIEKERELPLTPPNTPINFCDNESWFMSPIRLGE